jgi:hypothetical protein
VDAVVNKAEQLKVDIDRDAKLIDKRAPICSLYQFSIERKQPAI